AGLAAGDAAVRQPHTDRRTGAAVGRFRPACDESCFILVMARDSSRRREERSDEATQGRATGAYHAALGCFASLAMTNNQRPKVLTRDDESSLVPAGISRLCSPDRRRAGGQVSSAGFAEFGQKVHPALVSEGHQLTKGAVWTQVGLDDRVLDPHCRNDDCPIRNQA